MPPVAGALATAVLFLVEVGVPIAAIDFGLKFAGSLLLSSITSKLFGPKIAGEPNSLVGHQVMSRSGLEYRKIGYGQFLASGPIAYNGVQGSTSEFLWYQIAMLEGESTELVEVRFDKQVIPAADIDWTPGSGASDGTGTGVVSTTELVGDGGVTAASVFWYLGDPDQPVCGALDTAFGQIDSNHRLRGITHLVARLRYVTETETIWKSGPPTDIAAVWKGRKIYDPRLDSTNGGAGTHRYTDPTTWAWSDNPALCTIDYLVTIMQVDPAISIDWPAVIAAADDCDELVDVPTAATEKRFTCNGVLSLGASHSDNLDALLSSMDGKLSYSAGVWKIRASTWEASSVSLTEDDLVGSITVRGSAPESERFNAVRGVFVDPAADYETVEFSNVSSATYLSRDGGQEIYFDLLLPMTNTSTMAQRLAFRNLEQADNQITVSAVLNLRGFQIAAGDVVDLTISKYAWSAKTFRVIEWNRNEDDSISVTLKEDWSVSYDDPIESNYGAGALGVISVSTDVTPPVTGPTLAAYYLSLVVSWINPPAYLFDHVEVWAADNNDRSEALLIGTSVGNSYAETFAANELRTRCYWLRAVDARGRPSVYTPDATTTTLIGEPLRERRNWVLDPDFDIGNPDPNWLSNINGSQTDFWEFVTAGSSTADYVDAAGQNGSPVIDLTQDGGSGSAEIRHKKRISFKPMRGTFLFTIKYKTEGSADALDHDNFGVTILEAEEEFGGLSNITESLPYKTLPRSTDWATAEFVHSFDSSAETGYTTNWISFAFGFRDDQGTADTLRIDSVQVFYLGLEFGSIPDGAGGFGSGLVPKTSATDSDKVLAPGGWIFPLSEDPRTFGAKVDGVNDDVTAINTALALGRPVHCNFSGVMNIESPIILSGEMELKLATNLNLERGGSSTTPMIWMYGNRNHIEASGIEVRQNQNSHPKGIVLIGQDPAETFGGPTDVQCYDNNITGLLKVLGPIQSIAQDGSPGVYIHSLRRKMYGTVTADRNPTYDTYLEALTVVNCDVGVQFSTDANRSIIGTLKATQFKKAAIIFNGSYGNQIKNGRIEAPFSVSPTRRYAIHFGDVNYSNETGTSASYAITAAHENSVNTFCELPSGGSDVVALFTYEEPGNSANEGLNEITGNHKVGSGVGKDGTTGRSGVGSNFYRGTVAEVDYTRPWKIHDLEIRNNADGDAYIKHHGNTILLGGRNLTSSQLSMVNLFSIDNIGTTLACVLIELDLTIKCSGSLNATRVGKWLLAASQRAGTQFQATNPIWTHLLNGSDPLNSLPNSSFLVAAGTDALTAKATVRVETANVGSTDWFIGWDAKVLTTQLEGTNLDWNNDLEIL